MGSYVKMLLWVAILTLGFGVPDTTDASIASYVKQICERMPIHTTAPRTAGDNGFRIIIEGLPTADTYRPGETYTGKVFTFVCGICSLFLSLFVLERYLSSTTVYVVLVMRVTKTPRAVKAPHEVSVLQKWFYPLLNS